MTANKGLDTRSTDARSEVHALEVIDDLVRAGFEVKRVNEENGTEVDLAELLRRAIEENGIERGRRN